MSMPGYTKLFNSILASTIWREPDKVRIVWITLLAMAGKDGIAEGSVPGLADFARVSIEDCEKALEALQSPDKHSRTQEHDGRRIQAVDGGWLILNHAKYRAKMSADERRAYNREKQKEWRERKKLSAAVNDIQSCQSQSALSAHTEAEAEAEAEAEEKKSTPPAPSRGVAHPSIEEVRLCAAKAGLSPVEADKLFHHYESNGWKVGKNPMKSLPSAIAGWKLRGPTYGPRNEKNQPTNPRNFGVAKCAQSNRAETARRKAGVGSQMAQIELPSPEDQGVGASGGGILRKAVDGPA